MAPDASSCLCWVEVLKVHTYIYIYTYIYALTRSLTRLFTHRTIPHSPTHPPRGIRVSKLLPPPGNPYRVCWSRPGSLHCPSHRWACPRLGEHVYLYLIWRNSLSVPAGIRIIHMKLRIMRAYTFTHTHTHIYIYI